MIGNSICNSFLTRTVVFCIYFKSILIHCLCPMPRLPKRLELEKRKAKLAQLRIENASKPQFKSISEFLASLERCGSANSNEGPCPVVRTLENSSSKHQTRSGLRSFRTNQQNYPRSYHFLTRKKSKGCWNFFLLQVFLMGV